jgi:hypothetical protein
MGTSLLGICWLLTGAALLSAQIPRVGLIEPYGYQKLSPERISRMIGIRSGDPLPPAKSELEQTLSASNDVVRAHVEGYCCHGEDVVLYVGVLEPGARVFALHSPPSEALELPLKLSLVYERLVQKLELAHGRGVTGVSLAEGYPLSEDPEARRAQEQLALLTDDEMVAELGEVLRRSANEQSRIAAAYILAYAKNLRAAEAHLQYALRDFHSDVRRNALQSLEFIRLSLEKRPEPNFQISSTWLIEMLHSVVWADRVEAARMLMRLTAARDESVLVSLEERGLTPLGQMALWKVEEHAEAPYVLLGRIARIPEGEIRSSFAAGNRNLVLNAIRERASEKRRFLFF